jgi:hypothetical protein
MTAEIVNLRRVRKRRTREEREVLAAENRSRHGLGRAEREAAAARRVKDIRTLDLHKREPE